MTRLINLLAGVLILVSIAARPGLADVEIQNVVSPGGIRAWLVEDHTNPLIAMEVAFRGGSALDPEGREGLARMTASLIDEGAGELDSQAFQGRLEDLAIRLRFSAGRDSFSGTLETLTENRDEAVEMLRLALTQPRFDAEPVTRIRNQILAGIRQDAEDPDAIAGRLLNDTLFPGHPYGRRTEGTEESIARITVDDMRGFVSRRLARDNLVVGVVGDVTPDQLGILLDRAFGDLPAAAASWALPETAPNAEGQTLIVRKPVPQSTILFAQGGPKRDDPDFYAAYLANHIIGGGSFTSRLYEEAREKRGLVYGIGTGLAPRDHTGMIYGSAATQNARVAETIDVVRTEWARMAEGEITQADLDAAKAYIIGSYPLQFTSSGRIAGNLVHIQTDDLGIDYMTRRNELIGNVTLDQLKRVAGEILKPRNLTMIVVGDPENVDGVEVE